MDRYHSLTPQERQVIEDSSTEPPGSGLYIFTKDPGVYVCRRCDAPLYLSSDKFLSRCGWPSFDGEIENAVDRVPDPDGERTEIVCRRCRAHLGHIFEGEWVTPKNLRHCVNSLSLRFVPAKTEDNYERALFAGGCFWGVEYYMKNLEGVIRTEVGYTGGTLVNPSYANVCTGTTGHFEAVEIVFDSNKTNYQQLAQLFFEIHDPSQKTGQGPDIGPQYRSAIFYLTEEQKKIALELIEQLKRKKIDVATQLIPAGPFYPAEISHQDYYNKKGETPYCHKRVTRF